MNETIKKAETVETAASATNEKPYSFRTLSSEDMFLMFRILGKIGIKELKKCFEGDNLNALITTFKKSGKNDKDLIAVGVAVGLDVVDILLCNLPKCEKEIYQLLAQTSDMPEDAIKKDMILFTDMIVDFVKKEEFPAFIKVVSRLFK